MIVKLLYPVNGRGPAQTARPHACTARRESSRPEAEVRRWLDSLALGETPVRDRSSPGDRRKVTWQVAWRNSMRRRLLVGGDFDATGNERPAPNPLTPLRSERIVDHVAGRLLPRGAGVGRDRCVHRRGLGLT
ncbi:MAG: hypothetical protein ACK5WT_12720 [Betaproteobacteria bacterium]